jgi:hypothetical protein
VVFRFVVEPHLEKSLTIPMQQDIGEIVEDVIYLGGRLKAPFLTWRNNTRYYRLQHPLLPYENKSIRQ